MDVNKHDDIDRMIDRAVSLYGQATPLVGLEQRILNRIRFADSGRRGARWLRIALALATVLLLVAIGLRTRPSSGPTAPKTMARTIENAPLRAHVGNGAARVDAAATVRERLSVQRIHRARPLPKERMFPRLPPLSQEERNLLAYARMQPVEIQGARTIQPIEIEPIKIQPLQ
jgi:hypothetical protein